MRYQLFLLTLACSVLTGCFFRIPIEQGNIITQETAKQLHLGMTKLQVARTISTPVLDNVFQSNHWYYIYTRQTGSGPIEKRRMVLIFKNNHLIQIIQGKHLPLPRYLRPVQG